MASDCARTATEGISVYPSLMGGLKPSMKSNRLVLNHIAPTISPAPSFTARRQEVHMKQSASVHGKPATVDAACRAESARGPPE